MILVLLAVIGCSHAPTAERLPAGPPVRDLELIVGTGDQVVVLTAAGAWVEEDGDGRGEDVRATVPGPPPLTITGERSQWRLADGRVVFEGSVEAVRGPVRLLADRLEVAYAGERVREAWASGAVRVERDARTATAAEAHLVVETGEVVLTGEPRVSEGPNVLSGERIVLFLDDERLECDRCRLEVRGEAVAPP